MGNSLGGRKTAKIMKIDGETFKLKAPVRVGDVVKDYPGFVLMESEAVKHFGIRAKPLEPQQELKPRKLYFLIELPTLPQQKVARRVRSGIQMSAKDRLESLMLSRRSTSDLTILKSTSVIPDESGPESPSGALRVKLRLPKSQVAKLMEESSDPSEAAAKIMDLCLSKNNGNGNVDGVAGRSNEGSLLQQQTQWKPGLGSITETSCKPREKRVGFSPIVEGECA
ncbi:PREDICTED: uncharacterized protein At1g66480-like [Nelumbo nucifera]|uniref:Uncharacterized protein At1g66480-like n=1 Tax=Nelumbo nucifera TaxID=4432 RepID=A0A1U8BDC5_NELNU|nr:PREDICTED: uncharacterized protein At1g66480-like [Nelumbo nucifera]